MTSGGREGRGGSRVPLRSLLLPTFLLVLGCTRDPPRVEYGPPRSKETLQAMAVGLIIGMEDQWDSPTPIHAICVGVGRGVQVGPRTSERDRTWRPVRCLY
jgi:hypothetical protein